MKKKTFKISNADYKGKVNGREVAVPLVDVFDGYQRMVDTILRMPCMSEGHVREVYHGEDRGFAGWRYRPNKLPNIEISYNERNYSIYDRDQGECIGSFELLLLNERAEQERQNAPQENVVTVETIGLESRMDEQVYIEPYPPSYEYPDMNYMGVEEEPHFEL